MKQMSREYRAAKAGPDFEMFRQLGALGEMASRAGRPSFARAPRASQARRSVPESVQSDALVLDSASRLDTDIQSKLTMVRVSSRSVTRQGILRRQADLEAVATTSASLATQQEMEGVAKQNLFAEKFGNAFIYTQGKTSVAQFCAPADRFAQEILKPTHRQHAGHGDGLLSNVDEAFERRCCLVRGVAAKPLHTDYAFQTSPCCMLSFCIHRGAGLKAWTMHQNIGKLLKPFLKALPKKRKKPGDPAAPADAKRQMPVYPEARKLLDGGKIVLRLQNGAAFMDATEDMSASAGESLGWGSVALRLLQNPAAAGPRKTETHWLHIGYMNHTTRVFSVLRMTEVGRRGPDAVLLSAVVEDRLQTFRSFEFFKEHVDFDQTWRMALYRIRSTDEQVLPSDLMPSTLEVECFADVPEFICWKGWAEEKRSLNSSTHGGGGGGGGKAGGGSSGHGSAQHRPDFSDTQSQGGAPPPGAGAFNTDSEPEAPVNAALGEDAAFLDVDDAPGEDAQSLPSDASVLDESTAAEAEELAMRRLTDPAAESSASAKAPAANPPAKPEATAKARGSGGSSGLEVVRFEGPHGQLAYYQNDKNIVAFCPDPSHVDCRRTRTTLPGVKRGQGRCLGFLVAWQSKASQFSNQKGHVHECSITKADRDKARLELLALPGHEVLTDKERPREPGEDLEPARFT